MSNVKPTYISPTDGTPKPVDTSADSIAVNAVYVQTSATPDTEVGISRDGSGNLVLLDQTTGAKTLAQLAVGSGGTVTGVTASAPLASSGGAAPDISLTGVVAVANGGTGLSTAPTLDTLLVGDGAGGYKGQILAGGTGINVSAGPTTTTVSNTGVTSVIAGTGISVSGATGDVTISASGAGGTEAGQKEPVLARYDFNTVNPPPEVPTAPSAPTFSGTERFVGSGGGEYATLALAVAASAPGDIITVRAGYTTTETVGTTVNVNKSLEIRGENRATSGVSGTAGSAVGGNFVITIPAGTNNVWIHDLTITNNVTAAQDPGGVSANIAATGMTQAYPNGSTGLRFERLNLVHWKFGISIQGAGWVINDCAFSCRLATAGTTIRHIGHYGQTGDCFITNCVITPTTDATPRSQGVYMTTNFPGSGTYRAGQSGSLTIQNITQSGSGNWNAYYLQDVLHEPGAATGSGYNSPATPGSFSLYVDNVNFTTSWSGNSMSVLEATGTIAPLSFFDYLYFNNCTGQARTTGDGKGFFAVAGSTGSGRSVGAPVSGLYVGGTNTFNSNPSGAYVEGSTVDNLLGVLTTNYAAPSPLLAPTLPEFLPSGTTTADGVTLNIGDRVMLVQQDDATYSGIYEVQSGEWTRAADMAAAAGASGFYWWVLDGTDYASTQYVVSNVPGSDVVGSDALSFRRIIVNDDDSMAVALTSPTTIRLVAVDGADLVLTTTNGGQLDVDSTGGLYLGASNNVVLEAVGNISVSSATTLNLDAGGALSLNSSGAAINIGNDAVAQEINVGTGAAARTITLGNNTGATKLMLESGTGGVEYDVDGRFTINVNDPSDGIFKLTVVDNDINFITTTSGSFDVKMATSVDLNAVGQINIGNLEHSIYNDADINIGTGGDRTITVGKSGGVTNLALNAATVTLNGDEGSATEVLTSQGPGLPPIWAPAAGGLLNFTELTSETGGQTANIFLASGPDAAISAVLQSKTTGATLAQYPTSSTVGGNVRGQYATDFQKARIAATNVASGNYAVLSGGENNTASADYATVSGGGGNTASAPNATVGGGSGNTANSGFAVVAGGSNNSAGSAAFVGGGQNNSALIFGAVVGGELNNANNYGAFVGTGSGNDADGQYAGIITGINLTARGITGRYLFGRGRYADPKGKTQSGLLVTYQQTTTNTPTGLTSDGDPINGSNVNVLPDSSAYGIRCTVVARDNAGTTAAWEINGLVKRDTGAASTAVVGVPTVTSIGADVGAAAWTVALVADTTYGAAAIQVTDGTGTPTTVDWVATMYTTEVAL